jgi:hypothetical protein
MKKSIIIENLAVDMEKVHAGNLRAFAVEMQQITPPNFVNIR